MYFVELFPVPALAASDVDATLARALDADVKDSDRVVALHTLRGVDVGERERIARRLVAVLNEELHWVPSEALMVIDALAPKLAIGLDQNGLFRASPTGPADLVDDGETWHCADLGRVGFARDVDAVAPPRRIAWLARRPARFVVEIGGARRPLVMGSNVDVGNDLTLRFRGADVVAASRMAPLLVNGVAVGREIKVTRVVAGDVVEAGADRVRIVRASPSIDPDGRFRVAGPNLFAYLGTGEPVRMANGHVVGLGANEVGFVEANRADRFAWRDAPRFPAQRRIGAFGAHEVFVHRPVNAPFDTVSLGERYD